MVDRVGQKLGNYRITGSLGRGGFAEVYLAEHVYLKTLVAIKLLYTRLSFEEEMDSFVKEAQTIAQLSHTHIIRVLDFGVDNEMPYLVMDYAVNGNLRQRFPKGTRIPLPTVVSYTQQIADALQYAHDKGFIHQDIKPENILLNQNNTALLSDFGLAKVRHHTSSQKTDSVAGTAQYMSPEQFKGRPRPASDQYSLAIIVYEWLCGEPPFTEGDFIQLGFQHTYEPVPTLSEKIVTIAPDVNQVVMTALSKDAKQRFGSVKAFANALEQAADMKQAIGQAGQSSAQQRDASVPVEPPAPPAARPVLPMQGRGEQVTQFESVQPVQSKPLPQSEPVRMANTGTAPPPFSTKGEAGIANRPAQSPQGTPFAAPITPRPQQPARPIRPISIWQINSSRLIATLIGTVLYAVANIILDRWTWQSPFLYNSIANIVFLPSIADLSYGLILIIPFFFGATYGPWAGMIIALVGGLAGDALSGLLFSWYWYWYAGSLLPGLFAGIAFGRTQGNYRLPSARMTALRWCFTACLLFAIFNTLGIALEQISTASFFQILSAQVLSKLISIILLPFALNLFTRSRRSR